MNYRRNKRIRQMAFRALTNMLCLDEMRKFIMKQSKLDVLAKLIGIVDKETGEGQTGSASDELYNALQALTNALQDYTVMVNFLQQKGHVALSQAFEVPDIRIKEMCLALYVRLAQIRPEVPAGSPPLMTVVLDSDLISDVLSLPVSDPSNISVIRNMLILIQVMLLSKNEKAIDQMRAFDVLKLILNLVTGSSHLSYLALGCLGLLAKQQDFQKAISEKNKNDQSALESIARGLTLLNQTSDEKALKAYLRTVHIYLLNFDRIEPEVLELDHLISLIQALHTAYLALEDPAAQYYVILILKKLTEMENRQIYMIVNSMEQYAPQIGEAPTIYRTQQDNFIVEILDHEISEHLSYFHTDDIKNAGLDNDIVFFGDSDGTNPAKQREIDQLKQQVAELKAKDKNLSSYINEVEHQKVQLEQEIRRLNGVSFKNKQHQGVQTDLNSDYVRPAPSDPQYSDPQTVIKKLKEDLMQQARLRKDTENKNDYLQERITELEQDLMIRDRALQKLTQGTQMAETIGQVKAKIMEDVKFKFETFKSTIKTLENVIDTNSKLIKDLTEAVQDKNLQNQVLLNEDKVKQGQISQLESRVKVLDQQVRDMLSRETQMKMLIQKFTLQSEGSVEKLELPELQEGSQQDMMQEMHSEIVKLKVENLHLQTQNAQKVIAIKQLDTQREELEAQLSSYKSQLQHDNLSTYIIKEVKKDPRSLEETLSRINEALAYIDRTYTKHNYKEELVNFLEDRLQRLTEKYEYLLLQFNSQASHFHLCRLQLGQLKASQDADQILDGQSAVSDMIQRQWQESDKIVKRLEDRVNELHSENKALKVKAREVEDELLKYRKVVIFDQTQYERLFHCKGQLPMTRAESQVLAFFTMRQEHNEFMRMSQILDIFIRAFSELEYELRKTSTERLKNEFHLFPEQRELELRQYLTTKDSDFKIAKLEHYTQLIIEDLKLSELNNRDGNETQRYLDEAESSLSQINQIIAEGGEIERTTLDNFGATVMSNIGRDTQNTSSIDPNKQIDPKKKKVQTTNLVQVADGKKPRIANDYNKKQRPVETRRFDLQRLEQLVREVGLRIGQVKANLQDEQQLRNRHAADSLSLVDILKDSLQDRQEATHQALNQAKRILLTTASFSNQLLFRDFQLSLSNTHLAPADPMAKLDGALKVNNFLRKKECESREHSDLLQHKLSCLSRDLLASQAESRQHSHQIRHLQLLLKRQRSLLMTPQREDAAGMQDEDEVVKYMVKIEELSQKVGETEYMLGQAIEDGLEKDRLMRGTEDVIEQISTQLEKTSTLIEHNFPVSTLSQSKKNFTSLKQPSHTGPISVYERMKVLLQNTERWYICVQEQAAEIQRQKEVIEGLRPENQTLTQAEHQAKLEKYLNIYSARIQTLSSIIASYQRHFKSLEDQLKEAQGVSHSPVKPDSARAESLKRMITLKDILIKHQQTEIEFIKKAIISDKFNDLLVYVTPAEKEALASMRRFDLQVKVVQDYERQCLLIREGEEAKTEEMLYLKMIGAKVEQDLVHIREMFSISTSKKESNKLDGPKTAESTNRMQEYFERWLNVVKELIQSNFDNEKCKGYVAALNQEIPIIVDIIRQSFNSQTDQPELLQGSQMEKEYVEAQFAELKQEIDRLNTKINKEQDRCNFLRTKNQQLQEQNMLMSRYLHTKPALKEEFKHFYHEDLLNENQYLRARILSLTPYNEKLALDCGILRTQVNDLQDKILHQDERHLQEQILFQTLEQTLLDTQKKYIEKDGETLDLLKSRRDLLFRGGSDKALELLLQTADTLQHECNRLREQNWHFEVQHTQNQRMIDAKTQKIKESKVVLRQQEETIRDLSAEREKLQILVRTQQGDLSGFSGVDFSSISKEKLIYELGGKDGANYALKFVDIQAKQRDEINRLVGELAQLSVQNSTLKLLIEDKTTKGHKLEEGNRTMKVQIKELEEKVEKLEYQNQRLQDDFLVQQQSLDVFVQMALSHQKGEYTNEHAFRKCIDNAQTLAKLLQDCQRQRSFYFASSFKKQHELQLQKEELKLMKQRAFFQEYKIHRIEATSSQSKIQEKILQKIVTRYEKDFFLVESWDAEKKREDGQGSPSKMKQISVIDSPPYTGKKMKHGKSSEILPQRLASPRKPEIQTSKHLGENIKHLLICQLQLNEASSQLAKADTLLATQRTQSLLSAVHLSQLTSLSTSQQSSLAVVFSANHRLQSDMTALKMQNLYLSRWCLYQNRPGHFVSQHVEHDQEYEQVSTLMSQEIDKLKIENKLLSDRNDHLEAKLSKTQESHHRSGNETSRLLMAERELQSQQEWNRRMENELVTKSAQIQALSTVHNDFTQVKNLTMPGQNNTSVASDALSNDMGDPAQALANLRSEYSRLEGQIQKLHEKIYLQDTRNTQKDHKIQLLSTRVRELEKQMLGSDSNHLPAQIRESQGTVEVGRPSFSILEIQMQAEINEVWKRFSELNDLKNSLFERNEDLRVEVDSFKTHFSKYEPEDFKQRGGGTFETFQTALYSELTNLRAERDMLLWQLRKQACIMYAQRSKIEGLAEMVPQMEKELRSAEDREKALVIECGNIKELAVHNMQGAEFEKVKVLIQMYEGVRYKRDRVQLVYENSRLRRENESLRKESQASQEIRDQMLVDEYQLKKRLVELKNEMVKLRVRDDMGEYTSLIVAGGKSPGPKSLRKVVGSGESGEDQAEKVRIYVEDLTVMREQLLKIEFRNIELEELHSKRERDIDNLREKVKDLQYRLQHYEESDSTIFVEPKHFQEIDPQTLQMIEIQRKYLQEKWHAQTLQTQCDDQDKIVKQFYALQEKYLDEVKEHQRIHTEMDLLKRQNSEALRFNKDAAMPEGEAEFYQSIKDRYLIQIELYISEIAHLKRRQLKEQEDKQSLQKKLYELSLQVSSFDLERSQYKSLIDQISAQKLSELEADFFVSTQQHEEGLSKLEAHILNQRKKMLSIKQQLDVSQSEKISQGQKLTLLQNQVKTLELLSRDQSNEISLAKEAASRYQGERDLLQAQVAMMWARFDFLDRIGNLRENASIDQVVKLYKEEILKVRKLGMGHRKTEQTVADEKEDQSKSDQLQILAENVRLKNKERVNENLIVKLEKNNQECKLLIRLADMLRKTVGVSQLERASFEGKLSKKRDKLRALKARLDLETRDRERLSERVEYLEKQYNLKYGLSYVKTNPTFEPGENEGPSPNEVLLDPKELSQNNVALKQRNRELEESMQSLNQQVQELQISLKYYDSSSQGHQSSQQTLKSSSTARQARAITPIRIRDMQIKAGTMSQRLRASKQSVDPLSNQQEFYYGQGMTIDPRDIINGDQSAATIQTYNTKLPQIANPNHAHMMDLKTKGNARNMTPLPGRTQSSNTSQISLGTQNESQALRHPPTVGDQIKQGVPRVYNQSALGSKHGSYLSNKSMVMPNFETVEQTDMNQSQYKSYK